MRKLVNFSGIAFLSHYSKLANNFCESVNSNLSFSRNGCMVWVGKRRKVWLDSGRYIEMPIFKWGGTPESLRILIALFCGLGARTSDNNRWHARCGNPCCVNPEHWMEVPKRERLEKLYPDYIRDDKFHFKEYYNYYAVLKDNNYGRQFTRFYPLCDFLGISPKLGIRYLKTKRLLGGQWKISKDRIEYDYLNFEYEIPQGEEHEEANISGWG